MEQFAFTMFSQEHVTELSDPDPGAVKSLHCSSNGYWLAETSTADSIVRSLGSS